MPCSIWDVVFRPEKMLLVFLLGSVSALVEDNLAKMTDQVDSRMTDQDSSPKDLPLEGERRHQKPDNHFDLLIFTQHWPYTTCLDWEEKRHGSCSKIGEDPGTDRFYQCNLILELTNSTNATLIHGISGRSAWSVHGLWPTQFHKIGKHIQTLSF